MSRIQDFQPSKITLALKGLMVLFTNKPNECTIGLLDQTPDWHNKKIEIQQFIDGEYKPQRTYVNGAVTGTFKLEVVNTIDTGFRQRFPDERIDRFEGPSSAEQNETIRWLIDFERDFFPPPPIGARKEGFASFVVVDNGEIFTQKISTNHLQYKRGNSDLWVHFGRVAVELGIDISLDRPESKAFFQKDGQTLFEFVPGPNYQVVIERTETSHPPNLGSDADYYFTAIGTQLRPEEQLSFRSFPPLKKKGGGPPSTPDAACPLSELSKSDPSKNIS